MVEREDVLSFNYYTYGEAFSGSDKGKRYRIIKEERDEDKKVLSVCVWPEPFAFEHTDEDKKIFKDFSFDEEGLEEAVKFINATQPANFL